MSAFGRFCWKSRRWKSVKFYTCFDASVLERREGPHSPRPTYSMTLTLALRHVCSIVGHFFPAQRNFRGGRKSDFFNRIDPKMGYSAGVVVDTRRNLGAALQADGETRSPRIRASRIRRRSAAWSILLVWTYRQRKRASVLLTRQAGSPAK